MSEWDPIWYEVMGREDHRPTFITVNGTGSPDPFGFGFAGDVGRALDDQIWKWQPIGYPAATFPMGPSAQAGVTEVLRQIDLHPGKFGMAGYSQGALVTDFVWRDHLLTGSHAHRKDDCIAIVNFGDPMRAPGVCNGNVQAGFPMPKLLDGLTTGGIAGAGDLTAAQTPPFLLSCNNDGDLYGAAPVGDTPWTTETGVGHDETLIFSLVQQFDGVNLLAFVSEALTLLGIAAGGVNLGTLISLAAGAITGLAGVPITGATTPDHVVAIVEALLNGGLFAVTGGGAHGDYAKYVPAMVDWLNQTGAQYT